MNSRARLQSELNAQIRRSARWLEGDNAEAHRFPPLPKNKSAEPQLAQADFRRFSDDLLRSATLVRAISPLEKRAVILLCKTGGIP